jgi:hypothetical protein
MPFFTEHGTLGGYAVALPIKILLVIFGLAFPPAIWLLFGVGFMIGALPDMIGQAHQLFNFAQRYWPIDSIYDDGQVKLSGRLNWITHNQGPAGQWAIRHWWLILPLPWALHVLIDIPFHRFVPGTTKFDIKRWAIGEALHLAFNIALTIWIGRWIFS